MYILSVLCIFKFHIIKSNKNQESSRVETFHSIIDIIIGKKYLMLSSSMSKGAQTKSA